MDIGGSISQQHYFQSSVYVCASLSVGELGKFKPQKFLSVYFRYFAVLWVLVPKWCDVLLAVEHLRAKIYNETGIQITR